MTMRTRYFVIVSLLVLAVGVGAGLVAYYVGLSPRAFAQRAGTEELRYLPRDASVVAYADVHEVMTSELRQRLRHAVPMQRQEDGQRQFQNETGINIETDIDRVVACLEPDAARVSGAGMVLARGRFDEVKIEALMREHGAQVETYKNSRLIVADHIDIGHRKPADGGVVDNPNVGPPRPDRFALSFIEPGLVAVGGISLVRHAIDLHRSGGDSAVTNDELMKQVRSLESGNAWAVGRLDLLRSNAGFPKGVATQLPAIKWFSASGHVDGGLRGVVRAEAGDEEAAKNLRDVVRGFLALARLQAGSKPEFQGFLQSLELGGAGKTVALSFDVPAQLFDVLGAAGSPEGEKH
jgi:hypothetical protein